MQDSIKQLKKDIFNIVRLHKHGMDTNHLLKEIDEKLEEAKERKDGNNNRTQRPV